jgi:hypothetical protein
LLRLWPPTIFFIKDDADVAIIEDDNKTILFWNSLWGVTHFGLGLGNGGFVKLNCTFQNCFTTTNRSKLRDKNARVDAIIFHGIGMKMKEIEALKWQRKDIQKNMNQGVDPLFILFMAVSIINSLFHHAELSNAESR